MTYVPIPTNITEIQIITCEDQHKKDGRHRGHFALLNEIRYPLYIGTINDKDEWFVDQLRTGYAQAIFDMKAQQEYITENENPTPNTQVIPITGTQAEEILAKLRENKPEINRNTGMYL